MAKKPFKETKFGKFLHGIIREIPLIGGIIDHKESTAPEDGGEKGKVDGATLSGQITAVVVAVLALGETLGFLPGWVSNLIQTVIENIQF